MPWKETSPMDQRVRFVADHHRQLFSISELCGRFGVSRKTAYKCLPCPLTKLLPMSLTVQSR